MKGRKRLVLVTLAVLCFGLGSLGLLRAILVPGPVAILTEKYPSIGYNHAKIEVVVFEDFLCHTCKYFTMEIFPAIDSTYVESGIAKYVMIPLAFSARSREIANAALSIFYQAPHFYFPYVRELFLRFSDGNMEFRDLVDTAAKYKGIDLVRLGNDIKTGRYDQELDQNLQLAKKAMKRNLRTPAVFINGYQIPGISFESISTEIEEILNSGGQ